MASRARKIAEFVEWMFESRGESAYPRVDIAKYEKFYRLPAIPNSVSVYAYPIGSPEPNRIPRYCGGFIDRKIV